MSQYSGLIARIRSHLVDIESVVDRTRRFSEEANQSDHDVYWDAIALNLHSFYTAIERIFEDIARSVDESLPSGSDWHINLIRQMAIEIENLRPAVISISTRDCLDDYRSFRHIVRNLYTFNLRPSRVKELVDRLDACYKAAANDLQSFCDYLKLRE